MRCAEAAQVSPATVELVFGTKAALLDAVVDVALAGDDEPVPVLERGWVHALAEVSAADFPDAMATGFCRPARAESHPCSRPSMRAPPGSPHWRARQSVEAAAYDDGALGSRQPDLTLGTVSDLTPEEAVETVLVLIDPLLQRRLLVERAAGRWSDSPPGSAAVCGGFLLPPEP